MNTQIYPPGSRQTWLALHDPNVSDLPMISPRDQDFDRYDVHGAVTIPLKDYDKGILATAELEDISPIGVFWGRGTRVIEGSRHPRAIIFSKKNLEKCGNQINLYALRGQDYLDSMLEQDISALGVEFPSLVGLCFSIDPSGFCDGEEIVHSGTTLIPVYEFSRKFKPKVL